MGNCYQHITSETRIAISTLLRAGFSKQSIAMQLGVHRSTIYREINRNGCKYIGYLPIVAERRVKERKIRQLKLNEDSQLCRLVTKYLKQGWSPEQIAGRLKLDHTESVISHETIYRWIYSDYGKRNRYYSYLRKKRKWRIRANQCRARIPIPERVSITARPDEVNHRIQFGHWEGDLMIFSRPTHSNLITLRERVSRYFVALLNPSRHAKETSRRIINYFSGSAVKIVNSITLDNGSEFYAHREIIKQLDVATFFCDPYKSWQKGSVENGNGVLRYELPRNTQLDGLSQKEIDKIVLRLNRRPMKCLGYRTPEEVFYEHIKQLRQVNNDDRSTK